jgi:hypothetical protein
MLLFSGVCILWITYSKQQSRIVATRVTTSNCMKVNSPVLLTTHLTGSALCSLQWMCEGLAHLGDMSILWGMQD